MNLKKTPAFTLIEILIVVVIIAILLGLIVLDFQATREQKTMQLTAEQSLALLSQAKVQAQSGHVNDVDEVLWDCPGAYFKEGGVTQTAALSYNKDTESCDFSSQITESYGGLDQSTLIGQIEVGDVASEEIWVVFEPLTGDMVIFDASGNELSGEAEIQFGLFVLKLSPLIGLLTITTNEEE